jgi:3-phosphoshikimate 1-carboxyvinyltransferase
LNLSVYPAATLQGELRPPSDKSLTHRGYMLGAIAAGPSVMRNPLRSEDCQATLECLQAMGLTVSWTGSSEVTLLPAGAWRSPARALDCGNSGTTMRLMSGLIAGRNIEATLTGDESLQRRPMDRIGKPLRMMGAKFDGSRPPIQIRGSDRLQGIRYETPVPSAQIKSCVLFAGLTAEGETTVFETTLSRDHTERMLRAMGVSVISSGGSESVDLSAPITHAFGHEVRLNPPSRLEPFEFTVPADISSAAFFMVAAAILPEGAVTLRQVSVNPSRTGILDVFEQAGVGVSLGNESLELGEPLADIEVRSSVDRLRPFTIEGAIVPRLIDEIPVLAVLATQCYGTSQIRDAAEMRVKESDRIELIAQGLRDMGATVETQPDGLTVTGPTRLTGATIDCKGDHRIAMAFAVAGLAAQGETVIEGAECIATSFPNFQSELERLVIV